MRHGATVWNREHRFQGHTDVPLSEEGRAQARAVAAALRDLPFDAVVSSDLSRAYETACAIRGAQALRRDERWREFDFGAWEGLTWDEITRRQPELADIAASAARSYDPPGGESFAAVQARVAAALEDLRATNAALALVVTHAGPLHAMLHAVFGDRIGQMQELAGLRFTPASITRLSIDDGGAELIQLNDVSHLP